MLKIHYVMPMAGRGSRFGKDGFDCPKPLIEINGKPFFYWSTQSIKEYLAVESLDFVVLKEHVEDYAIDQVIHKYYPEARVHVIPEVTAGAVITAMKGIGDIEDDYPIVFNDCDHFFRCDAFRDYCGQEMAETVDGALMTFAADEPKYSFVQKDESGNVIKTVEKVVISNEAICGCYYFASKDVFLKSAEKYLQKCEYAEFFMSGVYNVMIEDGLVVKSFQTDYHIPFGTPEEYKAASGRKEFEDIKA